MSTVTGGLNIIKDGLVLYLDAANTLSYPGSGVVWSDLTKNNNNGILTNGPTFSSSNGGIITLDGTNDYISTPLTNINNVNFTYSLWFRTSTAQKSGIIGFRRKACFTTCATCVWFQAQLYITGDTNAGTVGSYLKWDQFRYCDSGFQGQRSYFHNTQSVTDGNWKNIVITSDSTSTILYLNNSVISTLTGTATSPAQAATFTLGVADNYPDGPLSGYYYTGDMAQAQFYNRALTATEVAQNYNATRTRFGV